MKIYKSMIKVKLGSCIFAIALVGCLPRTEKLCVRVSHFGFDPSDSTRFIQQALDSGAETVILDKQSGPWYSLPLRMRSNVTFELEPGVELIAKRGAYKGLRDYLFEVDGVTNAVIRGGEGSVFKMWKSDYQGPDYVHGEWRYALRITRSANILVEGLRICDSGGDGIGVSGKDIIIRNCVCDNNHRQGISVFDVENLLIEDTVMSNTKGTPPQAGIDFEPDRNGWKMSNVVMRNCRIENNAGNGIELFLDKLREDSPPISMRFVNCRTVGNLNSVSIASGARAGHHVSGNVSFEDCLFESPVRSGLFVSNKSADAFDLSFSGCSISNAPFAAVNFIVGGSDWAGPMDGVSLERLSVYQETADSLWFCLSSQGFGPLARRITGDVRIMGRDGSTRAERIDEDWVSRNLPVINGGVMPKFPRLACPNNETVRAIDAKPGEMVDLAPVSLMQKNRRYVFLADKKGPVRFVGRQFTPVKGRAFSMKPIEIVPLTPEIGRPTPVKVPQPLGESQEFCFEAPCRGFYEMILPPARTRFCLEKSSVPVALDASHGTVLVAGLAQQPFSLWFDVCGASSFQVLVRGGDYYRFACMLSNPAGEIVAECKKVSGFEVVEPTKKVPDGIWRLDFREADEPHYDHIEMDLTGVPSVLFLSNEKYWMSR